MLCSHTLSKYISLLAFILGVTLTCSAQQPNKAADNAYIITRMAQKFHIQPRALNDSFSNDVFTMLLKQIDEDKIFLTVNDLQQLSKYRYDIDDEIQHKQTTFLEALTKIFADRMAESDTMINNICKAPFNFYLPEKITIAEDTSYAANEKERRIKMYKNLKAFALGFIAEHDTLSAMNAAQQRKFIVQAEPAARRKAEKAFRHQVNMILQGVGGIQQALADEYCKAIALCYDPHTEYFPATEKEDFDSELGDKQMVFGIICKEEDDGSVEIESVKPGSPAYKSGQINKGDKIISIQWEDKQPIDVSTGGLRQLYEVMAMSNHDKATFTIKKQDGSKRSVVLLKEKSSNDENDENRVKSFVLKGNKTIGFISLPAFYQDWEDESEGVSGCANDVAKEIIKLKKENIEGLIIDLRYNGGGSMKEAIDLAGIFIDAGPVCQEKEKSGKVYTLKDVNPGTIYDGPLMFLVNGHTASASEVVAGTLQDYHRAVIVGSVTYGKATAQVVLPMDTTVNEEKDNSKIKADNYIKITVSELYRVTGETAQAKGVQPDVVLPDMLDAHPEHESDNLFALHPQPVNACKYFKPYPEMDVTKLQALASSIIDTSVYYKRLKEYIANEKENGAIDESLMISDVLESDDAKEVNKNFSKENKTTTHASYIVQNNTYEQKTIAVNDNMKEMDDQWIEFLNNDPMLQVAYKVMLLMIK